MKRLLLFASISFILYSCYSEPDVPKDCYPPARMTEIMVDINLAEGMMKANFIQDDSADQIAPIIYKQVFERNNADKDTFDRSMDFYLKHPKLLQELNERVVEELNKLESGIPAD